MLLYLSAGSLLVRVGGTGQTRPDRNIQSGFEKIPLINKHGGIFRLLQKKLKGGWKENLLSELQCYCIIVIVLVSKGRQNRTGQPSQTKDGLEIQIHQVLGSCTLESSWVLLRAL